MNRRNIALDIVLTILFCGLWNLAVQYDQVNTLNYLLKEEKYSFWKIYILTLITCGLYLVFWEYRKSVEFAKILSPGKVEDSDAVIAVVLALFGLNFIYDAILQSKINDYIDEKNPVIS